MSHDRFELIDWWDEGRNAGLRAGKELRLKSRLNVIVYGRSAYIDLVDAACGGKYSVKDYKKFLRGFFSLPFTKAVVKNTVNLTGFVFEIRIAQMTNDQWITVAEALLATGMVMDIVGTDETGETIRVHVDMASARRRYPQLLWYSDLVDAIITELSVMASV